MISSLIGSMFVVYLGGEAAQINHKKLIPNLPYLFPACRYVGGIVIAEATTIVQQVIPA
jgi:hypothetical protein